MIISDVSSFPIPHPFGERRLLPARFVARPNRFIGEFVFESKPEVIHCAHIADPGRLTELLVPQARVWVVDYRDHPTRKLPFAMPYVESREGTMVSIYSRLPNVVAEQLMIHNAIPAWAEYRLSRREPRFVNPLNGSKSCFDFLLSPQDPAKPPLLLEVKGASLVEAKVCKFPDAPTVRGARQLQDLMVAHQHGFKGAVLFICQRPDASVFTPHYERDPLFAAALQKAVAVGVSVHCITLHLTPETIQVGKPISVAL